MKESTAIQIKDGWIVDVSSKAYHVVREKVELSDWHFKKDRKYDPWVAYGQSQSENIISILFIKELADQVEGSNICCLSLHTSRSDRYWSQQTSRSSHRSCSPTTTIRSWYESLSRCCYYYHCCMLRSIHPSIQSSREARFFLIRGYCQIIDRSQWAVSGCE